MQFKPLEQIINTVGISQEAFTKKKKTHLFTNIPKKKKYHIHIQPRKRVNVFHSIARTDKHLWQYICLDPIILFLYSYKS